MFRISTIAVLCIISGPTFGQAQSPPDQATSPPQADPVVAGDWTMAAQNDELVVLVKPATPPRGQTVTGDCQCASSSPRLRSRAA